MKGWHFVGKDTRERFGARRRIQVGKTYRVKGQPVLCEHGLHASERPVDALTYAPSDSRYVCRVRLGGAILKDGDKAVATERTVLAMADVERLLHEFAIWCAERSLRRERKAGREPDERSWGALRVKRRWLDGKATDDELYAAASAAAAAATAAAWDAAWDAAAARAAPAARGAAWADAAGAAWADPADAARADARDAAERWAQNRKLTTMLNAAIKEGAA